MKIPLRSLTIILLVGGIFISQKVYADQIDSITAPSSDSGFYITGGLNSTSGVRWALGTQYLPGASHNICTISVKVKAVGSPVDAVGLRIYSSSPFSNATSSLSTGSFFSGLLVRQADSDIQIRNNSDYIENFDFTPCYAMVGGGWYDLTFYRDGSTDVNNYYEFFGNTSSGGTRVGTGSWLPDIEFHGSNKHLLTNASLSLTINGTENFSALPIPGFTSSSAAVVCSGGDPVSNGLCLVFSYLFIPSQDSLTEFGTLNDLLSQRAPFTYLYDVVNAVQSVSYNATSTPNVVLRLADLGVGSSTSFGNFLPNWTVLSSSTIGMYVNSGLVDVFKGLTTMALWVYFAYGSYIKILGLLRS